MCNHHTLRYVFQICYLDTKSRQLKPYDFGPLSKNNTFHKVSVKKSLKGTELRWLEYLPKHFLLQRKTHFYGILLDDMWFSSIKVLYFS